jgi:tryptophan synthase
VALNNDMDYATVLGLVREARLQGLTAPVLLMGMSFSRMTIYSPMHLQDIIIFCWPMEKKKPSRMLTKLVQTGLRWPTFPLKKLSLFERNAERQSEDRPLFHSVGILSKFISVSYVPSIAPSTTRHRMKFLASIADSFIYVVSKV